MKLYRILKDDGEFLYTEDESAALWYLVSDATSSVSVAEIASWSTVAPKLVKKED